jgi:hypothetical protein
MTVRRLDQATIVLEESCSVEDAECLVRYLIATPEATVDWRGCDIAHTAVIQVLLAWDGMLNGPPRGQFLVEFVAPLLPIAASGAGVLRGA